MFSIDPTSFAVAFVAQIGPFPHGIIDTMGGQEAAFDYHTRTFYAQFDVPIDDSHSTPTMFAVSVANGTVDDSLQGADYGQMQTIVYDGASRRVVGTGVGPNARYLEWFNSSTRGPINKAPAGALALFLSLNGVSAYDAASRVLYLLLCSNGAAACGETYLVGVDVRTGAQASQTRLCGDATATPSRPP